MTPPPMMTMLFGTAAVAMASSLVITPSCSSPGIGGRRGAEPAARISFSQRTRVFSSPECSTSTAGPGRTVPVPRQIVTAFFFSSSSTPARSCCTMVSFRASRSSGSGERALSSAGTPYSPAWPSRLYTSALFSSALVGMQPRFRQVPPRSSFSTSTTEAPSCAARMAAV